MYVPGTLKKAITSLRNEYTVLFSGEKIYAEMQKSTVRRWFQQMSIDFHKSVTKGVANMLKVVDVANAKIEESRRIQHRMGHFSPKPVAGLPNAKIKQRTEAAINEYAEQAEGLIPKFENAVPNQKSPGAFTDEWSELCGQAIEIISVVGGVLAVLAGEVDTGTHKSVAAAKNIAEADMEKAVALSAKMQWLH